MEEDVPNIPPSFWKNALGCTVRIGTINKKVFTGRLYVMDPQSLSVVLIQENSIVLIPGHAVHSVNTDSITSEDQDISDFFFVSQPKETLPIKETESSERKDKLKKWLSQNGLHIEDIDGTLKCQDHVFIEAPYNEENCFCTNVILLERIRGILAKLPVD